MKLHRRKFENIELLIEQIYRLAQYEVQLWMKIISLVKELNFYVGEYGSVADTLYRIEKSHSRSILFYFYIKTKYTFFGDSINVNAKSKIDIFKTTDNFNLLHTLATDSDRFSHVSSLMRTLFTCLERRHKVNNSLCTIDRMLYKFISKVPGSVIKMKSFLYTTKNRKNMFFIPNDKIIDISEVPEYVNIKINTKNVLVYLHDVRFTKKRQNKQKVVKVKDES